MRCNHFYWCSMFRLISYETINGSFVWDKMNGKDIFIASQWSFYKRKRTMLSRTGISCMSLSHYILFVVSGRAYCWSVTFWPYVVFDVLRPCVWPLWRECAETPCDGFRRRKKTNTNIHQEISFRNITKSTCCKINANFRKIMFYTSI